MSKESWEKWERFLTPEVLRTNLIMASVYIAAFEVLKNTIVDRIRDFYITGYDGKDWIVDLEYKEGVLSRNRSPVYASLDWLAEAGAITDNDIAVFTHAKEYRNMLAHELTRMLMDGLPDDFSERFGEMVALLDKIERWWIINVEIPTNPDFAGKADDIDEEGIVPGPIISLQMMLDVALGSDEDAYFYIREFKRQMGGG
ncbi:hypothetical protein D6779_10075 [Candidatus Parcubacteria bacterium]|nr:MAG: hypothetical protein D6779_10075 [Candidatus Parcubacteria bacterium]